MKRIIMVLGLLLWGLVCVWPGQNAEAAKGKLLFIPQDNRPISGEETADVVRSLGYEVVMPPQEYLNRGTSQPGEPDKLWQWVHENIRGAKAAMVSSDALLYGGLRNGLHGGSFGGRFLSLIHDLWCFLGSRSLARSTLGRCFCRWRVLRFHPCCRGG